jgi:hypothetical protein
VLGYFIEVSARHADRLMAPDSGFTPRQTMKDAVRFNSLTLHEEAARIAEAGGHAVAAEEAHFEQLVAEIVAQREAIAEAVADMSTQQEPQPCTTSNAKTATSLRLWTSSPPTKKPAPCCRNTAPATPPPPIT